MFIIVGYLSLLVKGYRAVYLLLGLELLAMGVVMFNLPLVSEVGFFLMTSFVVIRSVIGLLVLVIMMSSYGGDIVRFGSLV